MFCHPSFWLRAICSSGLGGSCCFWTFVGLYTLLPIGLRKFWFLIDSVVTLFSLVSNRLDCLQNLWCVSGLLPFFQLFWIVGLHS